MAQNLSCRPQEVACALALEMPEAPIVIAYETWLRTLPSTEEEASGGVHVHVMIVVRETFLLKHGERVLRLLMDMLWRAGRPWALYVRSFWNEAEQATPTLPARRS